MNLNIKNHLQTWVTILIVAVLALGLGIWLQQQGDSFSGGYRLQGGTVLPARVALKDFQLIGDDGQPFTNDNLKGRWSLMFFGFTHCPMVCPATLAKLNHAYQSLAQIDYHKLPQVIFISVDPHRDSPKQIRQYLTKVNPNFIGATGVEKQLHTLTKQVGVAYMKAQKSGDKHYDIQHTGAVMVVDPTGSLVAVLTSVKDGNVLASDVRRVQRRFN